MFGFFLLYLILGLVDGFVIVDAHRRPVPPDWGWGTPEIVGLLAGNALAVLIAFVLIKHAKRYSSSGRAFGIFIAYAVGFVAGIHT
jgi:hypothetical protein